MARHKIDPAISRKAYAQAEKALKELNADQFALLLDEAYAAQGVESPRQRSARRQAEAAQARTAAAARREERKAARVKALEAELASLKGGDPLF